MNKKHFPEVFKYPVEQFKTHLEDNSNERILFSGRYGMGKTSFLNYFFDPGQQIKNFESEKYTVFKLYPVNYSISSNEDIIRYIKYDLIIELLNKAASIEEIELGFIDALPVFFRQNALVVVKTLIKMIPKLGKDIVDSYDELKALGEKFSEFHKKANESGGDKMIEYIDGMNLEEGSLYENDVITKIITETIKKNYEGRNCILLVDDIDRLDPEHVFRILNVFAAHFDSLNKDAAPNKFGFDKVIIVCDFHNIRNIFHHQYGLEADFAGYIDKFYSSDIYHFDNKGAIRAMVKNILYSMKPLSDQYGHESVWTSYYLGDDFLASLISLLIQRNLISLRNVMKVWERKIGFHKEQLNFPSPLNEIPSFAVTIIPQLKLICLIAGDAQKLRKIIGYFMDRKEEFLNADRYFGKLLFILSYPKHKFDSIQREYDFPYRNNDLHIKPNYSGSIRLIEATVEMYQVSRALVRYNPTPEIFWNALYDVVDLLHSVEYLN